MESRTLQTFLRVLYTVNSNPQYILAKSLSQVPATPCGENATSEPAYAQVSLKACIAVVCESSPELLQDPTRDFSLYVLDPLEAQPMPSSLAHPPHNTNSPRGVAVALGLMSWAIESNDSTNILVTGTVILNTSPALEVVFALRETKRLPKPMIYSYPLYATTSVPGSSQIHNHLQPPSVAAMHWAYGPQPEQQTLTRSADFPEVYIGPPRRARGRPEGSTSSKSKIKFQGSTSSVHGAGSSTTSGGHSDSKQDGRGKARQKVKARPQKPPPTQSPFICAPLNRHSMAGGLASESTGIHPQSQSTSQSHIPPDSQAHAHFQPHNALIGLLSAISSNLGNTAASGTPEQQAALLSVLQGLLSSNPHLVQAASTNADVDAKPVTQAQPVRGEANDGQDDGDSDIVVLDSSAVDTAAFRKPGSKGIAAGSHDTPSLPANRGYAISSSQGTDYSPLPASTPSGLDTTPGSSQVSTPSIRPESTATVTPEVEVPTSKPASLGQMATNGIISQRTLDVPETPTPCRTRKRKLGEYLEDQTRPSPPMSSPSPSPSAMPASSLGATLAGKQRVQSSPVCGSLLASSPLARLPSMLGSIRAAASRAQINSSSPSARRSPAHLMTVTKGGESQETRLGSGSRKAGGPSTTSFSPSGLVSDSSSLKRRRTLNEVMAEQEARKNAKIRKRSSGHKLEDIPVPVSQAALPVLRPAQSSPPRPLFRSDLVVTSSTSTFRSSCLALGTTISGSSLSSTIEQRHGAPSSSTSSITLTQNPVKKFVLPAWARTSTATLPRLSEEALARQRAEQEAKKAQASLKRREAAKTKRKQLHVTGRPPKESSDDDDESVVNNVTQPAIHPPSGAKRGALSLPPPPPSLPVFASDTVEPIPPSPPLLRSESAFPNVPSTPPRKHSSSSSGTHRTPSKSGSCSLFTPSGQDLGSLFTPSTPSAAQSLTRATFTPRSPTVLHRSNKKRSPRKSLTQTPWTPKRSNNQTPKSSHTGRSLHFVSPGTAVRTLQQTGREKRTFLLPPPSPCAPRTLCPQISPTLSMGSTSDVLESGGMKRGSLLDKHNAGQDKSCEERDDSNHGPSNMLCQSNTLTPEETTQPGGEEDTNGNASRAEEDYASSPLPPSSPLPISPPSSPATKPRGSDYSSPTINNFLVPDSDILLPSVDDSDGPGADMDWLSDDASAWFTDPDAWLTDVEGGPLPTDSDGGAWFSDSDAIFGDASSLPPSCAQNWLSDDADVETDGEVGDQNVGFDAVAFERVFEALAQCGASESTSKDVDLWESLRPFLGGNGLNEAGATINADHADSVSGEKTIQELQEFLNGLVKVD